MAEMKFTETRLEELEPPEKGEIAAADTDTRGLAVRVLAGGAKTYFVRYRLGGRGSPERRMTLGRVGEVPLAQARLMAQAALVVARQGRDPSSERRKAAVASAAKPKATLTDLIDAHERDQGARGVLSAADNAKSLKREFTATLSRDPGTITRQEIVAVLDKVRDGVPGHAAPRPGSVANLRARIHGLLAWAENTGRVASNVMSGYRSKRRSRAELLEVQAQTGGVMLDMSEISALWRACEDPRINHSFGAYVKLLILTGCRRGEMAQARLSWITLARGEKPAFLNIPATITKNGKPHAVPLPPLAAGVVASVGRFMDRDPLVTPGARSRSTGKTATISGWSKSWPKLLKIAEGYGLARKCAPHDLRRSFRSHLTRLAVRDAVAEAALNHVPKDTLIAIYNKHDFLDERIEAAARWSEEIAFALGRAPPVSAEVVALRLAARTAKRRSLTAHAAAAQ
jgi:integrase